MPTIKSKGALVRDLDDNLSLPLNLKKNGYAADPCPLGNGLIVYNMAHSEVFRGSHLEVWQWLIARQHNPTSREIAEAVIKNPDKLGKAIVQANINRRFKWQIQALKDHRIPRSPD